MPVLEFKTKGGISKYISCFCFHVSDKITATTFIKCHAHILKRLELVANLMFKYYRIISDN